MNTALPAAISAYFETSQAVDIPRLTDCFSPQAVVHDEGQTHLGHEAIAAWQTQSHERFDYRVEVLDAARDGDRVVVTTQVVGNFPGSPVQLDQVFVLEQEKIQSLTIG